MRGRKPEYLRYPMRACCDCTCRCGRADAFTVLFRSLQPKLLPEASGVFFGLTLSTGKAELVRAVLESIGFMLRENLELLRSLGVDAKRVHFFGGGSKNAFWNQMIADITGTELVLMEQNECGSMGRGDARCRADGRLGDDHRSAALQQDRTDRSPERAGPCGI